MKIPKNYRKPVLVAVLLHVIILCALLFNFASNLFSMPPASSPMKTIHATAVSQASVNAELKQAQVPPAVNQAEAQAKIEKQQQVMHQEKVEKQAQLMHQAKIEKQAQAAKIQAIQKQKAAAVAAKKALVLQKNKMALLKVQAIQKKQKEKEEKAKAAAAEAQKLKQAQASELAQKRQLARKIEAEKLKAKKAEKAEKLEKTEKAEKAEKSEKAEKAQKLKAAEALKVAEAQKLNAEQKALQQKLMQQQMSGEQKSLTQVQSLAQQGEINKYKAEILSAIRSNWRISQVNSQLKCVYSVSLAPDGTVLSVSLVQSSGDAALDQSAQQAITLSSPLPVPRDPSVFNHFRQLVITLSPQGILQTIGAS